MSPLEPGDIFSLSVKLYALMTPTAVLSYFIAHTQGLDKKERRVVAIKTGAAIFFIGASLFSCGSSLFHLFGFTIDAFRIGVGVLLFLAAIRLMNGEEAAPPPARDADISVVPLAIPLGMGPSAIGFVMVLGADIQSSDELGVGVACLILASAATSCLLFLAKPAQKLLGKTGLAVMAKLTALILSAMAAQVIFTGIQAFLKSGVQP